MPVVRTVKVSNVSLQASQQDIKEFFSFSGDIVYVEMQKENDLSQIAYITFKDIQGAETAMLLTGATIGDMSVVVMPATDYELPPSALDIPTEEQSTRDTRPATVESTLQKAEDMVSSMLAKGFILGRDALDHAKVFDEKHQLSSSASARVNSLDKKIGFTEKISMGTTVVNEKVREMDSKYQVSEKTRSALAAAEQTVSNAGSAIMKNRYVLSGTAWVTGAFNKAKEKLAAETEPRRAEDLGYTPPAVSISEMHEAVSADDFKKEPTAEIESGMESRPKKPEPAQGLIL